MQSEQMAVQRHDTRAADREAKCLLVYAYHAGVLDSPEGFRRLQALRKLIATRGWDIADLGDPEVTRCLRGAEQILMASDITP